MGTKTNDIFLRWVTAGFGSLILICVTAVLSVVVKMDEKLDNLTKTVVQNTCNIENMKDHEQNRDRQISFLIESEGILESEIKIQKSRRK